MRERIQMSRFYRTINRPAAARGFTLAELLIVIAIIVVLLSLLLPAVNRVRQASRSAACASNLHQLDTAWMSFCADNKGFSVPYNLPNGPWVTPLNPYLNASLANPFARMCPTAADVPPLPSSGYTIGQVSSPWIWTYPGGVWISGSYTFNGARYSTSSGTGYPISLPKLASGFNPGATPVFADGSWIDCFCNPATDPLPPNFTGGTTSLGGIGRCCLDRHFGGVNVAFGDGTVRRVRIVELWTLDWNGAKSYSQSVPTAIENAMPAGYQ